MEMYFHLLELKSIFTQTPWLSSLQGFQVLVETEWLDFGHKFADRCGHGENSGDVNERCPVFLQWLDCVHQLQRQFPCSFQFNEAFLVKDATHWSNNTPQQTCLSWAINCLNVCKMMLNCKLWRLNELEVAALFLGFFFLSTNYDCVFTGEAGAAHLLVSVRDIPVQQLEGARGEGRTREHLLRLVSASAS